MRAEDFYIVETYLSHKPARGSFWVAAGTLLLCIFFSMLQWRNPALELSASFNSIVSQHEYWRLLTAIFVHADISHLLANSLPLTFFTFLIYGYFGFISFPIFALVAGALVNLFCILTYSPESQIVGASGVVYWMAGFWLTMFFLIERRYSIFNRMLRCMGFALITLVPTSMEPSVSYRAHAAGFVFGLVFATLLFVQKRDFFRSFEREEED